MRIRFIVSVACSTACLVAGAQAHEHGGGTPSPVEAQEMCVAEITAASQAAGEDPGHAGTICECLVPKIGEDPSLISEIETHGGLPAPGEASAELDAVVKSCLPAE